MWLKGLLGLFLLQGLFGVITSLFLLNRGNKLTQIVIFSTFNSRYFNFKVGGIKVSVGWIPVPVVYILNNYGDEVEEIRKQDFISWKSGFKYLGFNLLIVLVGVFMLISIEFLIYGFSLSAAIKMGLGLIFSGLFLLLISRFIINGKIRFKSILGSTFFSMILLLPIALSIVFVISELSMFHKCFEPFLPNSEIAKMDELGVTGFTLFLFQIVVIRNCLFYCFSTESLAVTLFSQNMVKKSNIKMPEKIDPLISFISISALILFGFISLAYQLTYN